MHDLESTRRRPDRGEMDGKRGGFRIGLTASQSKVDLIAVQDLDGALRFAMGTVILEDFEPPVNYLE